MGIGRKKETPPSPLGAESLMTQADFGDVLNQPMPISTLVDTYGYPGGSVLGYVPASPHKEVAHFLPDSSLALVLKSPNKLLENAVSGRIADILLPSPGSNPSSPLRRRTEILVSSQWGPGRLYSAAQELINQDRQTRNPYKDFTGAYAVFMETDPAIKPHPLADGELYHDKGDLQLVGTMTTGDAFPSDTFFDTRAIFSGNESGWPEYGFVNQVLENSQEARDYTDRFGGERQFRTLVDGLITFGGNLYAQLGAIAEKNAKNNKKRDVDLDDLMKTALKGTPRGTEELLKEFLANNGNNPFMLRVLSRAWQAKTDAENDYDEIPFGFFGGAKKLHYQAAVEQRINGIRAEVVEALLHGSWVNKLGKVVLATRALPPPTRLRVELYDHFDVSFAQLLRQINVGQFAASAQLAASNMNAPNISDSGILVVRSLDSAYPIFSYGSPTNDEQFQEISSFQYDGKGGMIVDNPNGSYPRELSRSIFDRTTGHVAMQGIVSVSDSALRLRNALLYPRRKVVIDLMEAPAKILEALMDAGHLGEGARKIPEKDTLFLSEILSRKRETDIIVASMLGSSAVVHAVIREGGGMQWVSVPQTSTGAPGIITDTTKVARLRGEQAGRPGQSGDYVMQSTRRRGWGERGGTHIAGVALKDGVPLLSNSIYPDVSTWVMPHSSLLFDGRRKR
ncbi:hypothetical protein IPL85_00540 [Candidatus Saccharibacteria bacterium]|nr:MAG: hypothetical protein IPL85_00540 [Candidatus Saccharibacteria bacterium]